MIMEPLKTTEEYREYSYRWVILTLFVIVSIAGGFANSTCGPITDQVSAIYDVSIIWVEMNTMVYEIVFIAAIFPCNYEIRVSVSSMQVNSGAGLTLLGSVVRLGAQWSFWPVLLGNALVALGMAVASGCTAKISAFWFRPDWVRTTQRTNATMIASVANGVGGAIGLLVPPLFVTENSKSQFVTLLLFEAGLSVVCCGSALILMRNRPPTPPSPSGAVTREAFVPALKSVMTNFSFVMTLCVVALSLGTNNVFNTVVEIVIVPYGFSAVRVMQTDAGILGGVMTISGLIGCLVTSPIVGRTRKYKLASLLINIFAAAGTFLFAFTLYVKSIYLSSFCVAVIGFGMMPISAFMIELACEVTYPVGEAMTTGLLNMGGQVIGIVGTFAVDALLFSPLLANLVLAVFMGLAGIVTLFIKEDLKRFASDKVVREVVVYEAPDAFLDTPPGSPLLGKSNDFEQQMDEVSINKVTV